MRVNLWSSDKGDIPANLAFTNNFSATAAPTASDDSSKGYQIGSVWIVGSTGTAYTCVDASVGAAVWSAASGLGAQGAPAAKTTSSTLTAADLRAGIITVNQGAGAASNLQLPTASDLDAALPGAAAGSSFDLSVINTSVVAAEDATLTTNTGWTLIGSMFVPSYDAPGSNSSGAFRARKTGAAAWTLYRIG